MSLETNPLESAVTEGVRRRRSGGIVRQMLRNPLALAGIIWLIILAVASFGAGVLAPYDPLTQDLKAVLQLPSTAHLLGTDSLGRDILSRIMVGGQDALVGALEVVIVAMGIGVPIGIIAGYVGGWFDALANRFADLLFSLPGIIVLLALTAVFGNSTAISMAGLGVLLSASYLRLVRASTLAVRNELYVDAAKVSGIGRASIIFRHILPNVVGPLIVQSSLTLGAALLLQAGLGFLGLGPTPPAPNWGGMVSEASMYINQQPWLMVPSGFVLIFTILAVNLIGDALRDGDGQRQRFSMLQVAPSEVPEPAERAAASAGVLSVRDLIVSFPETSGSTDVVRGVSFDLARGETLGLVGESGSGKTMTALAILGLLPYPGRVTNGQIMFGDTDLVSLAPKEYAALRGKRIGMISQEPMVALDPSFSVASQLIAPLRRHRRLSRAKARAEALTLLDLVGIRDPQSVLRSFPHELSGGMAQRVAIAIALSGSPEILIADEPTTALDVTVQAGILDLLRSLQEQLGMSIILVTHDLGVVADMCARAIVMQHGQIVESADIEDLFGNPQHNYTRQLIAATPSLVDLEAHRG